MAKFWQAVLRELLRPRFGRHSYPAHKPDADLQRQLRQAERQALLNLGQAWQREDITQAKLREAQEYRVEDKRKMEAWAERCQQAQEERDEAREQLKRDWEGMKHQAEAFRVVLREKDDLEAERDTAIKRAEAAERELGMEQQAMVRVEGDAAEQRALAEAYRRADARLALEVHNEAAMEMNEAALEAPAEAQAHRSPPSGQEEGDDD